MTPEEREEVRHLLDPLARLGRLYGPNADGKTHLGASKSLPAIADCWAARDWCERKVSDVRAG